MGTSPVLRLFFVFCLTNNARGALLAVSFLFLSSPCPSLLSPLRATWQQHQHCHHGGGWETPCAFFHLYRRKDLPRAFLRGLCDLPRPGETHIHTHTHTHIMILIINTTLHQQRLPWPPTPSLTSLWTSPCLSKSTTMKPPQVWEWETRGLVEEQL